MLGRLKVFYLTMLLALSLSSAGRTQTQDDSTAAQKATADKFLQLLLSRPQPGTALDKTVEYYQSIGELDALSQRIKSQATEAQTTQPEAAARQWLAVALIAQSQARWLESIELLRQAPDVAQHRWAIGQAQAVAGEQLQRWPAIVEVLQPLIDQAIDQPGQANAESVIEGARRLAKAYARVGQSDKAIQVWQKLEARLGRDEQIATRLASMAADEGELEFAIEVLDRILAGKLSAVKRMELAIQRTGLIARAGQEEKAIASYEQLLAGLNADSWLASDIAQRIEDLVVSRNGVDALLTYYRAQLAKRPDDMNLMLRLASTLDREKHWDESSQLFKQLIERTSTALAPRLAYAQSLIHQQRWHEAAAEFAKLAEQQPRNEDIINQWCEALAADATLAAPQRDEQIRAILEKRMAGLPPTAEAYQQLAARLQRFGQTERAVTWLAKAYELQPNDLSVLSDYSRALLELHREPEVKQATSAFEAAQLSSREGLSQLADLYADLGYEDLAITCLSRACKLGPTSAMRFRLCDWFEKAQRPTEAAEQLELAWHEIAAQTQSPSEQESLCEEIARRQNQLTVRQGKLKELSEKLKSPGALNVKQPALAGLDAEAVTAWRATKFLIVCGETELAYDKVSSALRRYPNSTMLWRLRAELDEQSQRFTEAVEAHRKLADLDVRRRSEHLLAVAKALARMGRIEAALQQTEAITTETASSQHIIEVFNLALDNKFEKFAINLLEKRLLARPGDTEVLQRLIRYHLDRDAFEQAAAYQWQNFQLMRTPEQREIGAELLIETHVQLHTLSKLEQKLEKFWRQHDLWREFGVWQAMIALRGNNHARAENLLARLAQSQMTRRFALENLLRLAELQGNNFKRFELIKQLAAIDSQAISTDEIAKVLTEMPAQHRSRQQAQEALGLIRGSSKRLALIQDLIQAGSVDMALRIIEVLPESEQRSWPVVCRTALLSALLPADNNAENKIALPKDAAKDELPSHVQSAVANMQGFTERSLELPETSVGQRLLEELLDGQKTIYELLVTSICLRNNTGDRQPISQEATNCRSALQAFQAVIVAQLQMVDLPSERRAILARQRELAMQQSNPRERAARLAALALVAHWQLKIPNYQEVARDLLRLDPRQIAAASANSRESSIRKRLTDIVAEHSFSTTTPLATRLAGDSAAFQYVISELNQLADQKEPLASLLCLWEMAYAQRDLLQPANATLLKRTAECSRNLGDYAAFAPAQIITLIATLEMKEHPERAAEYLQTLARVDMDRAGLKRVMEMVLGENDPLLVQALITSQKGQTSSLELIGELAGGRNREVRIKPVDLWRAVDYVWQNEVKQGLRSLNQLRQPEHSQDASWMKALPLCSLPMHESSLFHQLDFNVARAIVERAHSVPDRQELLKVIKQLADDSSTNSELRLVRQLAQVFVLEVLEQDSQSSRLLDVALPPDTSGKIPSAVVLRGQWLDIIGKHDAAIEWWLEFHQWPAEVRESTASLLLQLSMARHHDAAIDLAVKELRGATSDLAAYHAFASALIERDLLPQAETLVGEFRVLLPPTPQPLVITAQVIRLRGVNAETLVRWGQTDLLFALLQKYAKGDHKEATYRIARRLIAGAETATDDEFREHLVHFVERLNKSFKNAGQLAEFLEEETQRLDPVGKPRQALCVLRLISETGYASLARQIADRMAVSELTALQYLELARCELKLGQAETAAQFFARACELQPDWLDPTLASLNERSQTVATIAAQLNTCSNAGAGIGVASLNVLMKSMPSHELAKLKQLWIGWASNSRPKSLEQMRLMLRYLRQENFELWNSVVEQLLLADELQPATAAFDNANHWGARLSGSSAIEQQLLDAPMSAAERSLFQAMLQRVINKSKEPFLARLLLARSYLVTEDVNAAAEQLPQLLRNVPLGAVKNWLLNEWRLEIAKRDVNTNNAAPAAGSVPGTGGVVGGIALSGMEIDKRARAKLLLHLLAEWSNSADQFKNRLLLADAIAQLNGLLALPVAWQRELLKQYALQGDEAKVTALFEPVLRNYLVTRMDLSELLSVLANNGMDWQRRLIVIRSAQLVRIPLDASALNLAGTNGLIEPAPQMLQRLVDESRQLLPLADWNAPNTNPWIDCFKPQLVLEKRKQTLEIVSLLEALWPVGQTISDDIRAPLEAAVQDWSKDLPGLGAWETLALHDLAARLGDESLVLQAQERLLELAKVKPSLATRPWRLACWSAVKSSSSMASVAQQRFRLGEVARNAAAEYGRELNSVYVLMTIAQVENVNGVGEYKSDKQAVDKMADDLLSLVQNSQRLDNWQVQTPARGAFDRPDAIVSQVKINMLLFDKLAAQGNADLAIELLRNMCTSDLIVGTGKGITMPNSNGTNQTFDVLGKFQHFIDTRAEPERLQALLEDLLLKPFNNTSRITDVLPEATTAQSSSPTELNWVEDFDPARPLNERVVPQNMYSQLIEVARINDSLSTLSATMLQDSEKRPAHIICRALIDLEEGKVADALGIYRQQLANTSAAVYRDAELVVIGDAIFNRVKEDPLSDTAIDYSGLALKLPVNAETFGLLRQQFRLATQRNSDAAIENLLKMLAYSRWPAPLCENLRIEYSLQLLNARRTRSSLSAYMKGQPAKDKRPSEPDRYVVELMNRLPSLSPGEQAEIFRYFLAHEQSSFPWLECFAAPITQPLPNRFRHANAHDGLVFRALDKNSPWVSFLSWIAEYAERTDQRDAAIEAATSLTVDHPEATWGAAAITARLNPKLTPAALKNRLASTTVRPSPAVMQALLDCCASNEPLRAAAVEVILNLGFPGIALAAPTREREPAGWKHWLVMREETFAASTDARPRWLLSKQGQWTAPSSADVWYLMLRYPIEGDFRFSVTARQSSGSKFGLGVGGMAVAQHGAQPAVHCLGVGQRRPMDPLLPSQPFEDSEVPLFVQRQASNWELHAATASFAEQAEDSVPFVYLVNQGPGSARVDDWQLSSDLKIARQVDLLDSQLRMWRTTLGSWKLPPLRRKNIELDRARHELVHVTDSILHLPPIQATDRTSLDSIGALHFLRALAPEETISYEFYAAADSAVVHPALGRMVFRCEGERVKLQWLMRADDRKWLGLAGDQLFPLEPQEAKAAVKILPDAWNKVELTLDANKLVTLRLNGDSIAQVPLPDHLQPEFGLSVTSPLPAKVRHVKLSGAWPESLSIEQLKE